VIRASILLAIVCGAMPWLRRRSAADRHLLWTATLAAAACLPVLALFAPAWQPAWARQLMTVLPTPWAAGSPAVGGGDVDVVVRAIGLEATTTADQLVPVIWAGGTVLSLLLLIAQLVVLAKLTASARPVTDRRWLAIAAEVASALQLARPIRLLQSSGEIVPGTWGAWHPRVLLPASAARWSDDRLRAVLAHELAHVRRNDWTIHLLAEVVCAIYWFHPLFWIAKRGACRDSEQAADDLVLGLGMDGGEYAGHLLAIVRAARMPAQVWPAAVGMAGRSQIERRFAALLNADANRGAVTRRKTVAVAAAALLLTVPVATMSLRDVGMNIIIRTDVPPLVEPATAFGEEAAATAVRSVRIAGRAGAAGAVTPPEIVAYTTPPLYSDEARNRGVEGVVTVGARVERDGQISAAHVVRGLGSGLDQNAVVALRQWRFRPATRAGVPVAIDAEIDIEFSLRNDAVNALIANDMATRVGPGVTPPSAVRVFGLWPHHPKIRGTVVLDVVLLEDGTPKIVRILQSVDPELDERAVRNFEQWRFTPAIKNGRPVKIRMNAEVNFHG
jgi:TonB family protein